MGEENDFAPSPDPHDWELAPTAAGKPTTKGADASDASDWDEKPTTLHAPSGMAMTKSSLQPVDIGGTALVLPGEGDWEAADPTQVEASGPPQTVDFESRYSFRRLIGKGGMGEVNLYTDNTIGRDVAMKVIRGEGPRGRARAQARFVREARVQGQLEHPAIVPVYDLGSDPNGDLYFTMKRIRGKSLREIFKGLRSEDPAFLAQYSRRKLLAAFDKVCQSMAFAHARGVLHRDLKPANIMLGDFGEVYVLDWGLAKIRDTEELPANESVTDSRGNDIQQTVDGDVVGSLGFMAPEQLSGLASEIDERADVYALGALLFQILTHQPLHSGETMNDLVVSTLTAAPAPSSRAPDLGVPPELDAICGRALALERDERLASSAALSHELECFLDGDRNTVLRREAARVHADSAVEVMANNDAFEDEAAQRGAAMREVSSCLALEPDNETALRTFYRLLTEPPREVPAEAQDALLEARLGAKRSGMKAAASVYLSLLVLLPIIVYLGVKSWAAFTAELLALSTCFLLSIYHLKFDRHPRIPLDHLIFATVTVVVSTVVVGPFMLVPTVALANTAAYAAAANLRSRRVWVVAMGVLGLVVPAALQLGGVLPSTFAVVEGQVVVQSLLFELRPIWTELLLLGVYIPVIIGSGWFVGRVKSAHSDLETRMRVQAWQLTQIVPEKVRRAAAAAA